MHAAAAGRDSRCDVRGAYEGGVMGRAPIWPHMHRAFTNLLRASQEMLWKSRCGGATTPAAHESWSISRCLLSFIFADLLAAARRRASAARPSSLSPCVFRGARGGGGVRWHRTAFVFREKKRKNETRVGQDTSRNSPLELKQRCFAGSSRCPCRGCAASTATTPRWPPRRRPRAHRRHPERRAPSSGAWDGHRRCHTRDTSRATAACSRERRRGPSAAQRPGARSWVHTPVRPAPPTRYPPA